MALELDGVGKTYRGGVRALSDVSLRIDGGAFALLGPNGAGKSTLMNIAAGLLKPGQGAVRLDGLSPADDPEAYRTRIGYLPQRFGFPPGATPRSVLRHLAALRCRLDRATLERRIESVLADVHLSAHVDRPVSAFSGGMRQRLGIAQALIHEPELLILDEPTVGLDPDERESFLLLLSGRAERATIILSTHLIADVEAVCSSVGFLFEGRLVAAGSRSRMLERLRGRIFAVPRGAGHDGRALYETLADGRPVVRIFCERPPAGPARPCMPSVRDAYACQLAGLGR